MGGDAGIIRLMDDLGNALRDNPDMIMLGGGNPSRIPAVEERLRDGMNALLQSGHDFERMLGAYAPPAGTHGFRATLATLLEREYGWPVGADNIALTNGSQSAFFMLFNLFSGPFDDGRERRILLPLTPEYIGYADQGLHPETFVSRRPAIEELGEHLFKYRLDLAALDVGADIGALCVSRPTNPTGNVITDAEVRELALRARAAGVPLILDNAYGLPFPGIVYGEAKPWFDDNCIVVMSLSKLGLPGVRTGIVVAPEAVIQALSGANAIVNLSTASFGPALVERMVANGDILALSSDVIRPWYRERAQAALDRVRAGLGDTGVRVHVPEGAFFLWIWFPGLPIGCIELYTRLKARGVLVLPGHYFFPGLPGDWRHRHECIRLSYAAEPAAVARGIDILCDEVRRAMDED